MATYITLFSLVGAGVVVGLVAFIKSRFPEQSVRFVVMGISGIISLALTMYVYHSVNIISLGGGSGALYLLSQIYYEVGKMLLKWVTQKQPVTKDEIVTD